MSQPANPVTDAVLLGGGRDAALAALFHIAPHPEVAGAQGVALVLADLQHLLRETEVASLAPPQLGRAVARRQLAYVAGRLCAEEALRRLGRPGAVQRGHEGEPLWPAQICGSITHTDRIACAMVVPQGVGRRGLGIDSEQIDDDASLQAVLSICCTPGERAALFDTPGPAARDRQVATVVFALKEAFYKAIHPSVARFVDFDEVDVADLDLDRGHARLQPRLPEWPANVSLPGRYAIVESTVHAVIDL